MAFSRFRVGCYALDIKWPLGEFQIFHSKFANAPQKGLMLMRKDDLTTRHHLEQ